MRKSPGFTALELGDCHRDLGDPTGDRNPALFRLLDRQSLRVALSQLEADLRNVQQRAKTSGLVLAVEFNPT